MVERRLRHQRRLKKHAEILLSLVQGEDGQKWASRRKGWDDENGADKGETLALQMNQGLNRMNVHISFVYLSICSDNSTDSICIPFPLMKLACDWDGIECDKNKMVTAIQITGTGFSGSIPDDIGILSSLQEIQMGSNKLYGSIPHAVASLPNLKTVDFSFNRLIGTLPPFLSSQLSILKLGSNDLHGSIPNVFVKAGKNALLELSVPQNRLSGSIPDSLMDLKLVDFIDLSNNFLHGTIPTSIGKLSMLRNLRLNNNFLVGQIPHTLASSRTAGSNVGDLLEKIHLQDNQLSGTIPKSLEYLSSLDELLINENKLTGSVPQNICSADLNSFFYQGIPGGSDRNYCDAISCPSNTVALDGTAPCDRCDNPFFNPYIGQTRMCNTVVNQREILKTFYESTSLGQGKWNGNNNWEDDDTFLCNFSGIKCDVNFHVTQINLRGRGLMGTIPESIGFLEHLEKIDVSDNNLSGFLPSDLRWAPLESLDISGNLIRGIVPPTLCLKEGINDNGLSGDFNCHNIACPVGTYSPTGRQDRRGNKCLPCHHNNPEVLGYKSCRKTGVGSGAFGFIIALLTIAAAVSIFIVTRSKRKKSTMNHQDEMHHLEMQQQPITAGDRALTETETQAVITGSGSKDADEFKDKSFGFSRTKTGGTYAKVSTDPRNESRSVISNSSKSRASANSEESSGREMWLDIPQIT